MFGIGSSIKKATGMGGGSFNPMDSLMGGGTGGGIGDAFKSMFSGGGSGGMGGFGSGAMGGQQGMGSFMQMLPQMMGPSTGSSVMGGFGQASQQQPSQQQPVPQYGFNQIQQLGGTSGNMLNNTQWG